MQITAKILYKEGIQKYAHSNGVPRGWGLICENSPPSLKKMAQTERLFKIARGFLLKNFFSDYDTASQII